MHDVNDDDDDNDDDNINDNDDLSFVFAVFDVMIVPSHRCLILPLPLSLFSILGNAVPVGT